MDIVSSSSRCDESFVSSSTFSEPCASSSQCKEVCESSDIADGFFWCEKLLREKKILVGQNRGQCSERGKLIGEKLAENFSVVIEQYQFQIESELFFTDEK